MMMKAKVMWWTTMKVVRKGAETLDRGMIYEGRVTHQVHSRDCM